MKRRFGKNWPRLTDTQRLQALATLDRDVHVISIRDASDIDLWLQLAGEPMDIAKLADKTLENIRQLYNRYFES